MYEKYINSSSTHYISNSGSDENGNLRGGANGDQNGKEWQLRKWYSRPWNYVLRYPDEAIAMKFAELGCAAALNDCIGYNQDKRYTYWEQLQSVGYDPTKITITCAEDCTAGVTANVRAVGYLNGITALQNIPKATRSSNMRASFKKAGFEVLTEKKYLNGYTYLLPGDILLYENHHAAMNITFGANAKFEKPVNLGDRVLSTGMKGNDVAELQKLLIAKGYDLGKYGADGDFGICTESAVKKFQRDNNIAETGIYNEETHTCLTHKEPSNAKVKIVDGNCYIRDLPNTSGKAYGVAHKGDVYEYGGTTADSGWNQIIYKGCALWVSGKYSTIVEE